jgi:hypothetical protein
MAIRTIGIIGLCNSFSLSLTKGEGPGKWGQKNATCADGEERHIINEHTQFLEGDDIYGEA